MAIVPSLKHIRQPDPSPLTHEHLLAIHEALGIPTALPVWHTRGCSPLRLPAVAPSRRAHR